MITDVVAPGNSPDFVTDQGNVIFEEGDSLEIELGGTTVPWLKLTCSQQKRRELVEPFTINI